MNLNCLGRIAWVGALAAFFGFTAVANSTLTAYNVFVAGSFSESNIDIGGGLAAGGAVTLNNFNIVGGLINEPLTDFPNSTTFIAGGGFFGVTSLGAGNRYINGGTGTINNNGGGAVDSSDPVNFATSMSQYMSLSSMLGNKATTGGDSCTNASNVTTCTVNASGLNIINVANPSWFGAGQMVSITGVSASKWLVIDITGAADSLTPTTMTVDGFASNGDTTNAVVRDVLFNFNQATTLSLGGVMGSVLAPFAAVTGAGFVQMDGSLVAQSFTSTDAMEFHNFTYQGALTPEPATIVFAGVGLIVLAGVRKRRG